MKRRKRLGLGDEEIRARATDDAYPGEGPCFIADGYAELTRSAFAVWVRLAVAEDEQLHAGRGELAKVLGYSRRQCNQLLRELELKGFIAPISDGPWQRTTVVLLRRPMISRGDRFMRAP